MVNKVYVIIVTYNGMEWVERCLASVPKYYELVVVDNNSTDATVNFIEKNYPEINLFKEKKNLGFGQANNKGISYALQQGANYIYLLNQDAYLENDTIDKLIQVYLKNTNYGILSPIHTNKEKSRLDKNFANYLVYKKNKQFYSDFVLDRVIENVYEVPFVNAAGWLIPKKTLSIVGGFDPIFFHYGEDDNYCQRVIFHQLKIGVVPMAKMVHDREERPLEIINKTSDKYFKILERNFKVKYANINNDNSKKIKQFSKQLTKNFIKQLISIKLTNARFYKNYHRLIVKITPEILRSIENNRKKSFHYLNYEDDKR